MFFFDSPKVCTEPDTETDTANQISPLRAEPEVWVQLRVHLGHELHQLRLGEEVFGGSFCLNGKQRFTFLYGLESRRI